MSYYIRMIDKKRWTTNDLDAISGEAVTIDWKCSDNVWSVYKVDDVKTIQKSNTLNAIVLRMLADNPKNVLDGVDLLFLDTQFTSLLKSEIEEDDEQIKCKHCNIINVTYGKIKVALTYTLQNLISKVISYTPKEIKELIENSSEEYIKEYKEYCACHHNHWKEIKNAFLKDAL